MVLEWSTQTPYITAFSPSNLLATEDQNLLEFRLHSCYVPSSTNVRLPLKTTWPNIIQEPKGELFFTYTDTVTNRARIVRAKVANIGQQVQLLPSPPLDISTFDYHKYGHSVPPLVACPGQSVNGGPGAVLVAYQYLGTFLNSFVWEGGYRYAGIAQENFTANTKGTPPPPFQLAFNITADLLVVREGISAGHSNLQVGFSYYMHNSGRLYPYTSLVELFTPNSFVHRVGVAISETQLLLDPYVFEVLTNGE